MPLAMFYKEARLKWLYKILLKHETHPIRYSIVNPATGAEWFFDQKRHAGPKIRWEREFFWEVWENIRYQLRGEEAILGSQEYITNTTRSNKEKINHLERNAKIIGIITRYAKEWNLHEQYRKAWYMTRASIKQNIWERGRLR